MGRFAQRLFANAAVNRLTAHTTLHQLAFGMSGLFWAVFLLRAGIAPALIFLVMAGVLTLRFLLRPLVLMMLPRLGPRRTLVLGTCGFALQYPGLALVHGVGPALLFYAFLSASSDVLYWTCYHAFFAALGDAEHRGSQLGLRQATTAVAGVVAPALGGIMLTRFGAWAAFGSATGIELLGVLPLLSLPEPHFLATAPRQAYAAARSGVLLFFCDGWICSAAAVAWDIIAFRTLGGRYDTFGGVLALAALAGALGSLALGHFIDAGHIRRAAWLNAALMAAVLVLKAVCGASPLLVILTASIATIVTGLYMPALMTVIYNAGKAAPCALRFQFACEGGWDFGGALAGVSAALLCRGGVPLGAVILLALPAVLFQAQLLGARPAAAAAARAVG